MLKWISGGSSSRSRSSHVGKVFHVNEYRVIVEDVIAEGGFALVFLVKTAYGQRYALKRVAVNNEQDLFLCRQEIAVTKALSDCKHSVTYITSAVNKVNKDVSEVLILMQLYTGGHLVDMMNRRLGKGGFTETEVLKIFTDICLAVGRLHHRTKPIIHRDLKVENILRDTEGNFVLCDYGSCTVKPMHVEVLGAAECEDQISRFTTVAYRAPEMVSLFSGKTITTKADIWALGCLLYKLCFFTTPFGEQPLAIVSGTFTIPDDSKYTEGLHSLIRYMLEPDLDKRPNIWQVCEVAFKLRRAKNPIPNVFNSPRPPSQLRIVPRQNDSLRPPQPPRPTSANGKTPHLAQRPDPYAPTTTSISSRERPRGHHLLHHHKRSASPDLRPSSHLQPPQMPTDHCKSLDSGLDAFGSVPFRSDPSRREEDQFGTQPFVSHEQAGATSNDATVAPQDGLWFTPHSQTHRSPPHVSPEVRMDLFGATPFTPQQSEVDAFGSAPFVA